MSNIQTIQPETQKWLTNVVAAQLQIDNKKFEVACYANKVRSFRSGVEKDIKNVIQTETIFSDMVRGEVHPNSILLEYFQTTDKLTICKQILEKGRIQLTEQERLAEQDRVQKEIVSIICSRTVNPKTQRTYPPQLIEETIKNQLHYSPNYFSVSEQAAQLIKQIQQLVPLQMKFIQIQIEMNSLENINKFMQTAQQDKQIVFKNTIIEGNVLFTEIHPDQMAVVKEALKEMQCYFNYQVQKTFTK